MTTPIGRVLFYTPSFAPAGGIIKILDYACHAHSLGYKVVICTNDIYDERLPIFEIERFRELVELISVDLRKPWQVYIAATDLAIFSLPSQYQDILNGLRGQARHEQVVHIIQGIRHANPFFEKGYAIRLLTRPITRIVTNDIVLEAIQPYVNKSSMTEVIRLGHDTNFFSRGRHGGTGKPMRIAYTTWKSDVGDRVKLLLLEQHRNYEIRSVNGTVAWTELRDLYHWADVFLATPDLEEGFYLPGLEAMAAGAIVLSPDSGGNREYCRFGRNCVMVEHENPGSYLDALERLRNMTPEALMQFRQHGYRTAAHYSLEDERAHFGGFLGRLSKRLAATERRI